MPHAIAEAIELPALLEEMGRLLDAPIPPREFHRLFLERLLAATPALGGAVWQRSEDGAFRLEHAIHWDALGLESIPDGPACHAPVLQVAAQRDRALYVPPHSGRKLVGDDQQAANLSERGLLFAPVFADKQVVALVEIWVQPLADGPERRELAKLLTRLAGFVGAFLHKHQLHSLQEKERLWNQLEAFSRQVHASLDPGAVAGWVAHEGRRLLGCDQLGVAIAWRRGLEIAAISGANVVEPGSRLVQALEALCDAVQGLGEKLVHAGKRDDTLPPRVAHALDAYLAESNAVSLIVLPLDGCVLAAESHDPGLDAAALSARLEALARHAGPALANARTIARLPLYRLSLALAAVRDWTASRSFARSAAYAVPVVLLIALLVLVPLPLRLDAKGQLLPTQRQFVYAALTGKIVELKARHGDRVDKGQELLFMEDLDTQLQIDQLAVKIGSAEHRIALLTEQIGKSTTSDERNTLTRDRINQEYELRKAMAERDILLQSSRSPRKAPVLAPLAGKVVTFDVQEQLLGKMVKPGDPLLRLAAVKGPWEIELQIPERHLGPIREGLRASKDGFVVVDLLLANQPHRTYRGRLYLDGLGGETTVKETSVVLPARVRIDDDDLTAQLESLPVGLEVRAKVHCGPRPLGQVWFYELWEFLYEHVLF